MKKTKLYAKKTLSVFLAVMMLMSAWVFVAPTEAEAVSVDQSSVASYAEYHVEVKVTDTGAGHVILRYHPVNANGTVNTSVTDEYVLVNSFGAYTDGTYTFKTSDNSTRNLNSDTSAETGTVKGWLCGIRWKGQLHSIKIGNVVVLSEGTWSANSERSLTYNDSAWGNSYITNWQMPYINGVSASPASRTFDFDKNSTSSIRRTFNAKWKDQYGTEWPDTSGTTAWLQPAVNGTTITIDGNYAYIDANISTLSNLSNYNPSTGLGSSTLYMSKGGFATSCAVYFQSPKFDTTLQYYKGNTAKVYSEVGYYNQSVSLTNLPANTSVSQIANDSVNHQTYKWPDTLQSFTITQNTTFKEVLGPTETHTYGDYANYDATYHTNTCEYCGYVNKTAHQWDDGVITTQPTCEGKGVKTFTCTDCSATKTAETSANGHDFTSGIYSEKEAGENGTHYQKCKNCDEYGLGKTVDACEKHTWIVNETVPAKCEENGSTTYKCTVCDSTSYVITHTATGHNNIGHKDAKNVANSCAEKGWPEFWVCKDCGKIWLDAEKTNEVADVTDSDGNGIPDSIEIVNAHKFEGNYVSKTSGENGEHYRLCTVCGTAKGLDGVVDKAEPHAWGEPAIENSTCTSEGKKTYKCELCPQTYIETIAKVEHSMTKTDANAPSCTAPGNNEYYYCSTCTTYYKDAQGTSETTVEAEKLNKLTHTWTAHHEYDTLVSKATCTAVAVYNNHCDYCKEQIIGESHEYGTTDTVNGHNFSGDIVKNNDGSHSYACKNGCGESGEKTTCNYSKVVEDIASTCRTPGYTTYACDTCGNTKTDQKPLDLNNHKNTTTTNYKASTCSISGNSGLVKCNECGVVVSTGINDLPLDPNNHEYMTTYAAKAATCQTEGWKEYRYCTCGVYEVEKVTLPVIAHKFTTYISNGDGTHTATCDTCNEAIAPKVTDDKDCYGGTANCVDAAVCDGCGESYGDPKADNHKSVVLKAEVPATCQTEGTEAYNYCEACGKATEEIHKIDKLYHTYSAWEKVDGEDKHTRSCTTCDAAVDKVATETADCNGGTAYCDKLAVCADCGSEYGAKNAEKHSIQTSHLEGAKEATCQAPGFTGNRIYDCCNALKEAGTEIAQNEHRFDTVVEGSEVEATCKTKGEVTYKCSTCVETDDVKAATYKKDLGLDTKNHASEETVTVGKKAATCETNGHTGDVYYACCYDSTKTAEENRKALKEKGTTVLANGQHDYGEAEAVPEYMIKEIKETKDENGKVTKREFVLNAEPDYDAKVDARRDDNKWYHARICTICNEVVYTACYTYEHTYNCVDTDKCEICEGLCSLKDLDKHTNIVEVPQVDATHTTDGTRAYYKCTDCGKFFLDDAGQKGFDPESEEGKKLIAISKDTVPCTDWEEDKDAYVAPSCGQDGYKVYKCKTTGCTKTKKEVVEATSDSHEWSEEYRSLKTPTCGAVGYEELYCTVCDASKPNSIVTIAATGEHDFELVDSVVGSSCIAPTTEYYECKVCDAKKTETVYDGEAAHQWGDWKVVGGDCSTGVVLEQECALCHAKQQKTDSTEAHQYELLIRVEPTPESDGYETLKCKNCGDEKTEVIKYTTEEPDEPEDPDADNHVYDETQYRIIEEQSCSSAEIREYTCVRCGEKIQKAVGAPSDHTWLKQTEEIATCERDGHSEYYRCVRCLAEYGEGKIVYEATGHADDDGDGKCDSCGSQYYDNGTKVCNCMCHSTGFMGFIYKIVRFFWKLFKMNPTCGCGAAHY